MPGGDEASQEAASQSMSDHHAGVRQAIEAVGGRREGESHAEAKERALNTPRGRRAFNEWSPQTAGQQAARAAGGGMPKGAAQAAREAAKKEVARGTSRSVASGRVPGTGIRGEFGNERMAMGARQRTAETVRRAAEESRATNAKGGRNAAVKAAREVRRRANRGGPQ